MEIKDFNDKVIKKFTNEITDLIFLYIQNDEELMTEYLDLLSTKDRKTVNSQLGKAIKKKFDVENDIDDDGNSIRNEPRSVLIKTLYTAHKH